MTAMLERELGTGGELLAAALARSAALARAAGACAGVLAPARVWRRPDAVVAFSAPVAPGASLAEAAGEHSLSVGECVTVGVGVAAALAAMHAQRLVHGDISAANILVDGRSVTVVDTMGALVDGPAASPAASPAGDVAALGGLLRTLAAAEAVPIIEAWTEPLVRTDPATRPSAAHAAAALARCAPARPVRRPHSPVAAAIRAGALPRTLPRAQDRWWRAERLALRLAPLVAVVAVGVATGSSLVPAMAAAQSTEHASVEHGAVERAAVDLTERRVAALADGDATALADLTVPDSEAARSVPTVVEPLVGLEATDISATERAATADRATVEVTTALSGYSVGRERRAASRDVAVLELVLTERGWLVERVLPPP